MSSILPLCIVFVFSCALTCFLRAVFLKQQLMDLPNERSSHHLPTPHGGGLAIVISLLLSAGVFFGKELFLDFKLLAIVIAALPVATIGFLDDLYDLSAKKRLLIQSISAVFASYLVLANQAHVSELLNERWAFIASVCVFSFITVGVLNLYNFMDGINGIAGLESISLCLGLIVIATMTSLESEVISIFYLLLASTLGFLVWNFPNAKIFMGDIGSGFLGFVFAVAAIIMAFEDVRWIAVWLILFAAFLVDTSVTLIRRFLRGEKVYQAHCSHAYQHAARKYQSHAAVSIAFIAINLLFLLPLALLVSSEFISIWSGLFLAYLPLTYLAFHYKAGAAEQQNTG